MSNQWLGETARVILATSRFRCHKSSFNLVSPPHRFLLFDLLSFLPFSPQAFATNIRNGLSLDCQVVHDSRLLSIVSKRVESNGKTRFFSISLIRFVWQCIYLVKFFFVYLFIYLYTGCIPEYIPSSPSFFYKMENIRLMVLKKEQFVKCFLVGPFFFFVDIFFMLKIRICLNVTLKKNDVMKLL